MDFREIKEFFNDTIKYIIVIVLVLLTVIYVITLQQVVGPSMTPTLNKGDILLLSKVHYLMFDVKRNDIISFDYSETKYLIKRVVGLPGETIEYKNNILYIDGNAYKETFINNLVTEDFSLSDLGYEVIPEDMFLVLGDNRGDSMDSRNFGLINKNDIIGKAIIKIWPITKFKFIK